MKTRKQEHMIEINAPVEAVWKALTEAEELTRWFSEEARITPGEGGSILASWGEGQSGEKRIDVWEPGKRLRLTTVASDFESEKLASLKEPIVEEYTLESHGDRTVLRLVYSGVPDSSDWDGFYDGTNRGWWMFFCALRHYLEKHAGKARASIFVMHPIQISLAEAWKKLTGPEVLDNRRSLAGLAEGSHYSAMTSWGEEIEGEVVINQPPKTLCLTIEHLDNALFAATFEEIKGATFIYSALSLFGMEPDRLDEVRRRWSGRIEGLSG